MLALSASGIACYTDETYLNLTAMTHRVKAIEALNTAVARGLSSFEQGNAMIATTFCLLFQSALLNDGLGEYMSFIRGTVAIGIQMVIKGYKFMFTKLYYQFNPGGGIYNMMSYLVIFFEMFFINKNFRSFQMMSLPIIIVTQL